MAVEGDREGGLVRGGGKERGPKEEEIGNCGTLLAS